MIAAFLPALSRAETVKLVSCVTSGGDEEPGAPSRIEGVPLAPEDDWVALGTRMMRGQVDISSLVGREMTSLPRPTVITKRRMTEEGFPQTICFLLAGEVTVRTRLERDMLPPPPNAHVSASRLRHERFVLPTLTIGLYPGARWTRENVEPRVRSIREHLRLCGIEIERVDYRTLPVTGFDQIIDRLSERDSYFRVSEFERGLEPLVRDLPRPALVYVKRYGGPECGDWCGPMARAYVPGNMVLRRSPLADLAFLPDAYLDATEGMKGPPELTDTHELGHLLLRDPGHFEEAGNIMSYGKLGPAWTESQCERLRGSPLVEARPK